MTKTECIAEQMNLFMAATIIRKKQKEYFQYRNREYLIKVKRLEKAFDDRVTLLFIEMEEGLEDDTIIVNDIQKIKDWIRAEKAMHPKRYINDFVLPANDHDGIMFRRLMSLIEQL